MKKTFTFILTLATSLFAFAQTTITNNGFENWDNAGNSNAEPTSWNSNKTAGGLPAMGPQTCFKETSTIHTGAACVRVETLLAPIGNQKVNGNVTTGVVKAPSISNKLEGYLEASGSNKMAFTGRPDSLIGYYQYTQGDASETAKVRAILHSGDYYDPEVPVNSNHSDLSANKIGDALFISPAANQTTWQRFSVPFTYTSSNTPAFIMINITSSANQNTNVSGSKLWVDDIDVIYNNVTGLNEVQKSSFIVYNYERTVYVDFSQKNDKDAVMNLYDLTGKLILSQSLESKKKNAIQLPSTINAGIYMYQINGSSSQKTGKLIVE